MKLQQVAAARSTAVVPTGRKGAVGPRRLPLVIVVATVVACLTAALAPAVAAPYELDVRKGRDIVLLLRDRSEVVVIPGSPDGANPARAKRWSAADLGLVDNRTDNRHYVPYEVASGDVDGDGWADLVVLGIALWYDSRGVIVIVPGSSRGMRLDRAYELDLTEDPQGFGRTLLVSDLDSDGVDDVVASHFRPGEPGLTPLHPLPEDVNDVVVFWGSADGVRTTVSTTFPAPPPLYGETRLLLGVGNVLRHTGRELVVATPGLDAYSDVEREVPGGMILCRMEPGRRFSCDGVRDVPGGITDIAVADILGGGRADVVLGQPHPTRRSGGSLWAYRARPDGLAPGHQITQDSAGVPGVDEPEDGFGTTLGAADIDHDGKADLVVGAPGEDHQVGRVTLLHGHRDGLGAGAAALISQNTRGVPDRSEPSDRFGSEVSLLDVDGNGRADLLVGAPQEDSHRGALWVILATRTGRLDTRSSATIVRPENVGFSLDPRYRAPMLGAYIGR